MQITLIGDKREKSYQAIESCITKEGYNLFTHAKRTEIDQLVDAFKSVRDTIVASDLVVADVSVLGPEFEYQLALALEFRRPTLLLVSAKHTGLGDILALKNRNLTIETYRTDAERTEIVLSFINSIKNSLDAKLFMNIPPSMNKYLDWVATHTRFSKSDVVRDAVEAASDKDDEYQAFLKSLDT